MCRDRKFTIIVSCNNVIYMLKVITKKYAYIGGGYLFLNDRIKQFIYFVIISSGSGFDDAQSASKPYKPQKSLEPPKGPQGVKRSPESNWFQVGPFFWRRGGGRPQVSDCFGLLTSS